jgi:hypothetical protein
MEEGMNDTLITMSIKENSRKEKLTERGFTHGKMAKFMMESGKMG